MTAFLSPRRPIRFLYVSDWGASPKIVRLDLDGRNPYVLPVSVENPNGIANVGNVVYFTDSHYGSAVRSGGGNGTGTTIFNKLARLSSFDYKMEDYREIDTITTEVNS